MEKYSLKIIAAGLLTAAVLSPARAAVPDGYVVKVDSEVVYLDWGKASGVVTGDLFEVYRAGAALRHPVTGEVLGTTEATLAKGTIDQVEDKFSIGRLQTPHDAVQAADRTRWQAKSAPVPVAPAVEPAAGGAVYVPPLKEIWRSDPMKEEVVSIAIGDIDGKGQKELIAASRKQIQVYRWNGTRLELITTYEEKYYRHTLGVEAADLKHQGHDDIFLTTFMDSANRPHVLVLHWDNGQLKEEANIDGFVRTAQRMDGTPVLLWQTLSRARDMAVTAPAPLEWVDGKYKPGAPLKFSLPDQQIFGFTWGDWDQDHQEDRAILQNGEQLRVYFNGMKWSTREVYGGTKADFAFDNEHQGSLFPRLTAYTPAAGKPQLIVPHNIPSLGIRLMYLKLYQKSEIWGLAWNGLDMAPTWKLSLSGYLADYGVGDVTGSGAPQLWVASSNAGDRTVLIAYSLP